MKSSILKIGVMAVVMIFLGAGVSLADGWKNNSGKRGYAYGHYKQQVHQPYYRYAPPRPVYVERHYRPVVVERRYYHAPVRYVAPAPSGFFFGMSMADAGAAFSFGISGR